MILDIKHTDGHYTTRYYRTERQVLAAFYYWRRKAQAGGVGYVDLITDPTIYKSGPRWIYNGGKVIKSYIPPEPADDEAEQLKNLLLTSYFYIGGQSND